MVVGFELSDAVGRDLKALVQGRVGGALPVGDGSSRRSLPAAELFDLGAQVGLVVKPRSGDLRLAGDDIEIDWAAGIIDAT